MAGFVLDASTALAWAFEDESTSVGDAALGALVDGYAIVPPLWAYELANGLQVGVRRRRITPSQEEDFLADLDLLDIRVDPGSPSPRDLMSDAGVLGLTSYDAAYVLLARDLGVPLASSDRAVRRAARSAGVAHFAA